MSEPRQPMKGTDERRKQAIPAKMKRKQKPEEERRRRRRRTMHAMTTRMIGMPDKRELITKKQQQASTKKAHLPLAPRTFGVRGKSKAQTADRHQKQNKTQQSLVLGVHTRHHNTTTAAAAAANTISPPNQLMLALLKLDAAPSSSILSAPPSPP